MGSITHKSSTNSIMGIFNDVYSDYAFLNECIKMRYIMNSRKTSLKLKHQKNKSQL
jgi:hypothetical protein